MSHNITVEGGKSIRLKTAGKYCDRDIVVTAEGGKEDLDDVLAEHGELIATLQNTLRHKASGGGSGEGIEMIATFADGTTKTYVIYEEIEE